MGSVWVCAHGIYIDQVALLHVERSKFSDTHSGHHIKSRALRTEVINCVLQDGPEGNASYLIEIPIGGTLIAEGNTMQKGPKSENQANAIMIGAEGVSQPTGELLIKNNTFTNNQNRPTTFVHNITATRAQLIGNVFRGRGASAGRRRDGQITACSRLLRPLWSRSMGGQSSPGQEATAPYR